MVTKFRCGLCGLKENYVGTRKGLRKHLREEHRIMNSITNSTSLKADVKKEKQSWWIREEF